MKKSILIPILLVFIFRCSPDEETQAPTNSVQTTTPEPVVTQYTLTVTTSEGGSVTDGGTFDDGTDLTITATPNEGYQFIGWEGSDESTTELTITLNSDISLTALFQQLQSITSLSANEYLRDGTSKKTNRLFNNLDLEVLYSDTFAIWWDKSTGIDHYADAVDILKWSEISYNRTESYAASYRPLISHEYYINIYIHHPSYTSGAPDGFPNDWGQWVGGEDYEGAQGPYVAFPYGTNIIEINEYEPRMNVAHEIFHVVQNNRPRRTFSDGSWWGEATASLFELILISENPNPDSFFRGKSMHGAPSLVMVPHFSPWYAPNAPNGPGEWDLWSAGIHKYQTSYFLRYISQNSSLTIEDIFSIQFKEEGDYNNNNYYYYEPITALKELLGADEFEQLFVDYVKAVSDLTFLSEYERVGYLRAIEDVLTYPIEDKRIALEVSSNGEYSPNYKNHALSWTLVQVNGTNFEYEINGNEFGDWGTESEFHSFVTENNGVSIIYVVNTSDKTYGDETFDYSVTISGL
jgi:hypothetical protein